MSSVWQTKKLGELCQIELGKTPARGNKAFWDVRRQTRNVWLSIADLLNAEDNVVVDSKEYLSDRGASISKTVAKGTLLVSFKLTLGRLAFAGRDLFTNEAIAALTIFDEGQLSKEFLFWFLHAFDWRQAAENDVKLKGMTLNKAKLREIPVTFPPPPEQRRIVGILDEAFAAIASIRVNTEWNMRNARELFDTHLNAVFRQQGEDWVTTTIDQLSMNLDSQRVPITKVDRTSGEFPQYGASGIVDHVVDYIFDGDALLISEDGANLLARSTPIAFSVSGKYWVNNHAHILKFANMATQRYLEFYIGSIKVDGYITGAAQPKLTQRALNAIPVRVPKDIEAQAAIVRSLEALKRETEALATHYNGKLAALDALKQSLLHQAFTGAL